MSQGYEKDFFNFKPANAFLMELFEVWRLMYGHER